MIGKACLLAVQDYYHEKILSACVILSLAAVLAPLLVLYGVKFGVISTMTDRLKNNPTTLEIIPVASGHYTTAFFEELASLPNVAFVLPRTRAIAATMTLSLPNENNILSRVHVSLEPTAPQDVLLQRYLVTTPSVQHTKSVPQDAFAITLSAEAARRLHVAVGDNLVGRVERTNKGRIENAQVALWVEGILPLEAQQKAVAFIPLSLLEATEDFRDGRKPLEDARLTVDKGWTGEEDVAVAMGKEGRVYPAFRLYARSLEDVETLRIYFEHKRIDVFTQAEQIAAVFSLSASLNLIFGLIGTAAALGFGASTSSNALATVRRKERHLGILRLMGFSSGDIMTFPLFQSVLTSCLGTLLATALYLIIALLIDYLFAQSLQGIEQVCSLPWTHLGAAFGIVLGLSLLATVFPAVRAARVEPSEVIRDV